MAKCRAFSPLDVADCAELTEKVPTTTTELWCGTQEILRT
jgi:hypothetical protein